MARGIVEEADPGQVVCFVDYAYGSDATIVQMIEYYNGIRERIPYVISIMTEFMAKLKEFNLIQTADQITASGYFILNKKYKYRFSIQTIRGCFLSRILLGRTFGWNVRKKHKRSIQKTDPNGFG